MLPSMRVMGWKDDDGEAKGRTSGVIAVLVDFGFFQGDRGGKQIGDEKVVLGGLLLLVLAAFVIGGLRV